MLGVYRHIPNYIQAKYYLAGDINSSVIAMWKRIQKGWKPRTSCSPVEYNQLKYNGRSSAVKGFLGHALGFRGIYFNTYRYDVDLARVSKQVADMRVEIQDINFLAGSYEQFSNIKKGVIYCDPPYMVQMVYRDEHSRTRHFDYEKFYKWAKFMAKNNVVFISERVAKLPIPSKIIGRYSDNEKLFVLV